ncbi:hypothetical protein [Flavobacterium sp. 5]|uniref:hypothetical protein n=1 Tax=Flavobacterium sp. 5 TaxID=2035199 RepID=UPI000C2BF536|nr:hypothetical protein [Flavobacterium sp. 5]PKB15322.1 hypothetical protein CLU82_0392 [Flavobacterium sp. 5]
MKFIFLITFCSLITFGKLFASNDSIISLRLNELKSKGINNSFVMETYSTGCHCCGTNDNCNYESSQIYFFWRDKDKDFIQTYNKCGSPIKAIHNKVFDFYLQNRKTILKEEVKSYLISEKDGLVMELIIDDSRHVKFYLGAGEKYIVKEYDAYQLTNMENDQPNQNFERNNSLKLVKLQKSIDDLINTQ